MASAQGLAQLLADVGWRPEQFAKQLSGYAEGHGHIVRLHPKTPYKWLAGKIPRRPWPTLATALLSDRLGRLVTPADLGWPDTPQEAVPASTALLLPWTAAGGLQAATTVTDAGIMHRRLFLTLTGAALTAPAHEWLIAHPATDTATTSGHRLDPDVVDHLDTITAGLRRMDDHLGGGHTLHLVQHHLATVVELLTTRRYTEPVGLRLHTCAAELLRLAGFLAFDDGQHAQAQRYWIAALHEAHTAADTALGANILGFMSCQAKDLGQTRQAVTLAQTALAGYPGASPTVNAILALRAAEAHANEQSQTQCRRAIDAAFTRLADAAPGHGNPPWSYWMTEAQAHAQAGYCHLKLKNWKPARTHLSRALHLQGDDYTREGALRQALLATTYAQQEHPDLDRAIHLGRQAVDTLSGQVNSTRCVKHISELIESLKPYQRVSAAREFTIRATELLRTTTRN